MKIRIARLIIFLLIVALSRIGISNAVFSDQATISGNTVSMGCWAKPTTPTLVYPVNNYVASLGTPWLADPYMDWNGSTGCPGKTITYQYESYHNYNGSVLTNLAYLSGMLSDSRIPAPGTPDGEYYWHVRAYDGEKWSDWSEVWHLTVDRTPLSPTPTPSPSPSGSVVINEVYYDSSFGEEGKDEWIELYNSFDNPVVLTDWHLVDGAGNEREINSDVSIPGKGFAVLSHDASVWTHWSVPAEAIKINLGKRWPWLNNDGDELTLYDSSDKPIDFVAWENYVSGWNLVANEGRSIARKVKGVDTDSPLDWQVLDAPNPGTNPHPFVATSLDFYSTAGGRKVGFKITGDDLNQFDKAEYTIIYNSDQGEQAIKGSVDIDGENKVEVKDLILGSCSSGGTCVYHSGITTVNLEVILSGPITRTLSAELNF